MNRKKGIPLVALVIFVVLLVTIIVTCLIILGVNKTDNTSNQPTAASITTTNTVEEPEEEEIGEEITEESIINADSDIQKAYKIAGNSKTFAKYAMYESDGFNIQDGDVSNDLLLQLAIAQVSTSDMDASSSSKSIKLDTVQNYVTTVWGEDVEVDYKDFSLYNSDKNFTDQYKTTGYKYNSSDNSYEVVEGEATEEYPSEITELVKKVVKYNSKIEIYVQPIYVQSLDMEEYDEKIRAFYGEYDFTSKSFPTQEILAIKNSDYQNAFQSQYNQDIDKLNQSIVEEYIDSNSDLTTYMYTLEKTSSGYNLISLEEAPEGSTSTREIYTNQNNQAEQQEKTMYNATFEKYKGNSKKGLDVKLLIEEIRTLNSQYEDDTDKIATIEFDGDTYEIGNNSVETFNQELETLSTSVISSAYYNISLNYKSGYVSTVTITSEEE